MKKENKSPNNSVVTLAGLVVLLLVTLMHFLLELNQYRAHTQHKRMQIERSQQTSAAVDVVAAFFKRRIKEKPSK